MLVMSAGAHLFNCMSIKARHICFFFDYAAIGMYTFTAGQVFYFYSRPVDNDIFIFNTPCLFLGISAAISFSSTFACCYSFSKKTRFDAVVKAGTYTSSWLFNTSPYLTMLLLCDKASTCSSLASVHYFWRHSLFYAGGTLAYVFRIPEQSWSHSQEQHLQTVNSILLTALVVFGNISVLLWCTKRLNLREK